MKTVAVILLILGAYALVDANDQRTEPSTVARAP